MDTLNLQKSESGCSRQYGNELELFISKDDQIAVLGFHYAAHRESQ